VTDVAERIAIQGTGSFKEIEKGKVYRFRWRLPPETNDGKPKWSPQRTFRGRKADAREAMEAYKKELEDELNRSGYTVGSYARQFHEARIVQNQKASEADALSPLTLERDELEIRRIEELFGDTPLENLRPGDIRNTYDRIRTGEIKFKKHGIEKTLSENEINKLHAKLRQVMEDAFDNELIDSNPCDRVKNAKKPAPKERRALSEEKALELANTLKKEPRSGRIVAVWLALALGLRRGEALGLVWEDFDLDNGHVQINKQLDSKKVRRSPKTKASVRRLALDAGTVEFLREWRQTQSEQLFDGKTVPGTFPVCSNETGDGFLSPAAFDKWRRRFFVDNGLGTFDKVEEWHDRNGAKRYRYSGYKGYNLHELRHTQATLLAGSNELSLKDVQDRMGHTNIITTMNYTHHIAENESLAADWFEDHVTGGPANGRQ
jgi:integrase